MGKWTQRPVTTHLGSIKYTGYDDRERISRSENLSFNFFRDGGLMARTAEGKFQDKLLHDLEAIFKGCLIMKNDSSYRQGIPDLLVLYKDKWALLEVKKSANEIPQPNQRWYVEWGANNSFGAFIFPENKDEVLEALSTFFK